MRKIAIVPTLLTLGNAVCGLAAICFASRINAEDETAYYYAISALFILGAMVFDALDGYAARLLKTASDFGGQLDSLCDAISFGAAPGFILIRLGFDWSKYPLISKMLILVGGLYMLCAILRLARFNVENSPDPAFHKRFKGLPSPGAAGCIATLAILRGSMVAPLVGGRPEPLATILNVLAPFCTSLAPLSGLLVALLMVSKVPYPHMTKQILGGRAGLSHIIKILVALCVLVLIPEIALFAVFWGYALFFLARHLIFRALRSQPVTTAPVPPKEEVRN